MFGLYGKIVVQPGKRDELVGLLLEGTKALEDDPGCLIYLVNVSPGEPDTIWVTEVCSSEEAHAASLTRDEIRAIINRGRPLITGGERIDVVPVGGKGLSTD